MRLINNITESREQQHIILFNEFEINFNLKYLSVAESWIVDVTYKEKTIYGVKLSVGVLHMKAQNYPFDFVVIDNENLGLDPVRIDDFSLNRCSIFMLESDDMENIRGFRVQI